MDSREAPRPKPLLALFTLALVTGLTLFRLQGPTPLPLDASATSFSATRAQATLRTILGDERPHPVGTPANKLVRDRLLVALRGMGLNPELQRKYVCNGYMTCATVENIIVPIDGREQGRPLLLAVHYDSVPAGPGASDDGSGVAVVLEIARALREGPKLRRPLILLIGDGEEVGLLGAEAFVAHHPAARDIDAVVNLEARGTTGLSSMFETARDNGWLMQHLRALPYPSTSSLFYTVYERLPNDTDFTVFKKAGQQGLNFAFIGSAARYHTPLDNIENLSLRTLQHHGDNALAAVRSLGNATLRERPKGNAIYFDILSTFVVSWPEGWALPLSILNLLILAAALFLATRAGMVTFRGVAAGALVQLGVAALASGVVFAGGWLSGQAGNAGATWIEHPSASIAFAFLAAATIAALLYGNALRRTSSSALLAGSAVLLAMQSIASAATLPGTSFLLLLPAVGLTIGLLWEALRLPAAAIVTAVLPVLLASLVHLPLGLKLYDAMGLPILPVVAFNAALLFSLTGHTLAGFPPRLLTRAGLALGVLSLLSLGVACIVEPFGPNAPQPLNVLLHHDGDLKTSRWLVTERSQRTKGFREAASWSAPAVPFPWWPSTQQFRSAAAAMEQPQPPLLEKHAVRQEGRHRVVTLQLRSPRNAARAALSIHGADRIEAMKVNGVTLPKPSDRYSRRVAPNWLRLSLRTVEPEGVTIELTILGAGPIEAWVEDQTFGLPPEGSAITGARGPSEVQYQDGDITVVTRRTVL